MLGEVKPLYSDPEHLSKQRSETPNTDLSARCQSITPTLDDRSHDVTPRGSHRTPVSSCRANHRSGFESATSARHRRSTAAVGVTPAVAAKQKPTTLKLKYKEAKQTIAALRREVEHLKKQQMKGIEFSKKTKGQLRQMQQQ